MAGAPRTPDGKINMTGPVPKVNGKPDLSGIWQVQGDPRAPNGLFGLGESLNSRYFRDILSDFKPEERPLTPLGVERLRQHTQPGAFNPTLNCLPDGVPHGDLLPEPFKIMHTPGVIVMLYEVETTFRQIFMDGRKLPADMSPTWQGYSVGRWDGDTLVVDTVGIKESVPSYNLLPHSDRMRITERIHLVAADVLHDQITIDDPVVLEKPFTYTLGYRRLPNYKMVEFVCENNREYIDEQGRVRMKVGGTQQ